MITSFYLKDMIIKKNTSIKLVGYKAVYLNGFGDPEAFLKI